PFHTLAEEAAWWIDELPEQWEQSGHAIERRLVDTAVDALRSLSESQGEQVLLHQDLHGWNVLAAQREPWLVIDPKPLVGEREFGLAPIIRSQELGAGTHRLPCLPRRGAGRGRARCGPPPRSAVPRRGVGRNPRPPVVHRPNGG